MEDKRITAEQIKRLLVEDVAALAEQIAAAMNAARDGRIIDDSEEPVPVPDAHAHFRQRSAGRPNYSVAR